MLSNKVDGFIGTVGANAIKILNFRESLLADYMEYRHVEALASCTLSFRKRNKAMQSIMGNLFTAEGYINKGPHLDFD